MYFSDTCNECEGYSYISKCCNSVVVHRDNGISQCNYCGKFCKTEECKQCNNGKQIIDYEPIEKYNNRKSKKSESRRSSKIIMYS